MRIFVLKRLWRVVSAGVSVIVLGAAVVFLVIATPVLGNTTLIVRSGSMTPTIGVGDLVVVRPAAGGYHRGDIIAFRGSDDGTVIVTHRIVDRTNADGVVSYVTQGDANDVADAVPVTDDRVVGRAVLTIPAVGKALAFGKTREGFFAFVVTPALLIIVLEVVNIVRELRRRRSVGGTAAASEPGVAPMPHGAVAAATLECQPVQLPPLRSSSRRLLRMPAPRLRLDSVVAKVLLLVVSVGVTLPSGFALYADSEVSSGNLFTAACAFTVDPYADAVASVDGTFGAPTTLSSDPGVAVGLVTGPPDGQFIQISDDSSVTLQFVDNVALPSGDSDPDIQLSVIDALFPAEATVSVSQNCTDFTLIDVFEDTADADVDIDGTGFSYVQCVRITDLVADGDPFPQLGYDLDAAQALNPEAACAVVSE